MFPLYKRGCTIIFTWWKLIFAGPTDYLISRWSSSNNASSFEVHIIFCLYTWKVGVDQFPTSLYVPAALRCKYLIRRLYLWDNFLPGSVINSISGIYSPHRGLLQPTVCFFILRSLHHDAATTAVEVTARAARAMSCSSAGESQTVRRARTLGLARTSRAMRALVTASRRQESFHPS